MTKRKILMTLLPLVTLGSIVGAGFSAWVFESTIGKAEKSMNVEITDKVANAGSITTTADTYTLVMDQGGIKNKADVTKGITLKRANGGTAVADTTIPATYSVKTTEYDNLIDSGHTLSLTTTICIHPTLATYVTLTPTAKAKYTEVSGGTKIGEVTYITYQHVYSSAELTVDGENSTFDMSIDSANVTEVGKTVPNSNKFLQYTTNKPTDDEKYDTMDTLVSSLGSPIKISFTGEYKVNA